MGDYPIRRTESSTMRKRLDFPVIDTDGHIIEAPFAMPDLLKKVGGADIVPRFENTALTT